MVIFMHRCLICADLLYLGLDSLVEQFRLNIFRFFKVHLDVRFYIKLNMK